MLEDRHTVWEADASDSKLAMLLAQALVGVTLADTGLLRAAAEAAKSLVTNESPPIERIFARHIEAIATWRTDPDRALACGEEIRQLDRTPHQGFANANDTVLASVEAASGDVLGAMRRLAKLIERLIWEGNQSQIAISLVTQEPIRRTFAIDATLTAELLALVTSDAIFNIEVGSDTVADILQHDYVIEAVGQQRWEEMVDRADRLDFRSAADRLIEIMGELIEILEAAES